MRFESLDVVAEDAEDAGDVILRAEVLARKEEPENMSQRGRKECPGTGKALYPAPRDPEFWKMASTLQ